jgi:hypothetical protein
MELRPSWALMAQHAQADRFGFATPCQESSPLQPVAHGRSQKSDRYWYAHRRRQEPVISGMLAGYVRRSVVTFYRSLASARVGDVFMSLIHTAAFNGVAPSSTWSRSSSTIRRSCRGTRAIGCRGPTRQHWRTSDLAQPRRPERHQPSSNRGSRPGPL